MPVMTDAPRRGSVSTSSQDTEISLHAAFLSPKWKIDRFFQLLLTQWCPNDSVAGYRFSNAATMFESSEATTELAEATLFKIHSGIVCEPLSAALLALHQRDFASCQDLFLFFDHQREIASCQDLLSFRQLWLPRRSCRRSRVIANNLVNPTKIVPG
jgi:hypothetical protein